MTIDESKDVQSAKQNDAVFQANIADMTRYMRFYGMYYIIAGAITCIGIITALFGIPSIKIGLRLREAADAFSGYAQSNAFEDIAKAVEKQTRAFFIMYVLLIISLVIMGIYILVLVGILLNRS